MMLQDPITTKMVALLITRLMLLTGAIAVWRQTTAFIRIFLLLGSVSLVVSSTIALTFFSPVGPFTSVPGIIVLVQAMEVGGWICFSVGFLLLGIERRKGSHNKPSDATL